MGLGSFGGGLGAVEFLLARGAKVRVTDLRAPDALAESLARIDVGRLDELILGEHPARLFTDADLVVVNPAVRRDHPLLELSRAHNIPLTSEMNLFWTHLDRREAGRAGESRQGQVPGRRRIIGVTGSNGKSTTTALIHHILRSSGRRAWLGGNLGGSLLPEVDQIGPDDSVVLELSSFMLADLDRLRRSPDLAVVTSFAPNHLDWHSGLDDYRHAKQAILRWQQPGDVAVLNADDDDIRGWQTSAERHWFGESHLPGPGVRVVESRLECGPEQDGDRTVIDLVGHFSLPGRHNRWNAAAAVAAVQALGIPEQEIVAGLETFAGLPHRLQLVAEGKGRRFYNDSLATTPESAICALEAFDSPIVLLAGGYDKKVDLRTFAEAAARRAKGIALLGETGQRLEQILAELGPNIPRHRAADLGDAMAWAVSLSDPGDIVLLSPACASFDWFRNFVERGERFTELAKRWCLDAGDGVGRSP